MRLKSKAFDYFRQCFLASQQPNAQHCYDRAQEQANRHGWARLPAYPIAVRNLRADLQEAQARLPKVGRSHAH